MNFGAYGLESSHTPYVSRSSGGIKVSSGSATDRDGAAMQCITVTKVVNLEEEEKEAKEGKKPAVVEPASEEMKEQKQVEDEAVAVE